MLRQVGISVQSSATGAPLEDVAFYFPGPLWTHRGAIKNLLLFFERIALLVPSSFKDVLFERDQTLAPALLERGALDIIEPRDVLTEDLATELHPLVLAFADSMKPTAADTPFRFISWSRLGGHAAETATRALVDDLRERGLAGRENYSSVEIDPMLWSFTLTVLSFMLSDSISGHGLLAPATDLSLPFLAADAAISSVDPKHELARVVASDLEDVSIDLDGVLVEDILAFRAEYRSELLNWRADLTDTVTKAASLGPLLGQSTIDQRRQELRAGAETVQSRVKLELDFSTLRSVGFGASAVALGAEVATDQHPVGLAASAIGLLASVVRRRRDGSPIPSYLIRARNHAWTHEDEYSVRSAAEQGSAVARRVVDWNSG